MPSCDNALAAASLALRSSPARQGESPCASAALALSTKPYLCLDCHSRFDRDRRLPPSQVECPVCLMSPAGFAHDSRVVWYSAEPSP